MKIDLLRPGAVAFAIGQGLATGYAWADCTTGNSLVTCTGDLESYVNTAVPDSTSYSDAYTFDFKNLTSDLTESSSSNVGIEVSSTGVEGQNHHHASTGGHSMILNFDGGNYAIDVPGNPVIMSTTGGKGHSGNSNGSAGASASHSGGKGVAGGFGGYLTLNWQSGALIGNDVKLTSTGGDGGKGGEGQSGTGHGTGGTGGLGATGGALSLHIGESDAVDSTVLAIKMIGTGGAGGYGGEGYSGTDKANGGTGGQGGTGSNINVTLNNELEARPAVAGDPVYFDLQSIAGNGGHGGNAHGSLSTSTAGDGGLGGYGGAITFDGSNGWLDLENQFGVPSIYALSQAGQGGHGGNGSSGATGKGGDGGEGGTAGDISIDLSSPYTSIKNEAVDLDQGSNQGVLAQSIGGAGGNGGNGTGGLGNGKAGGGGGGGNAGQISIILGGVIETNVGSSEGILAQSVAGLAGAGGYASGAAAYASSTQSGGSSDGVHITTLSTALITTTGDYSSGIHGQSVGGGGGRGSDVSGIVALGGDGSAGGDGGKVSITHGGGITTHGDYADGIALQSVGGSGGASGASDGLTAVGGDAGSGGSGGALSVSVLGTVSTMGDYSDGVLAQSVGGGGGKAHSTSGLVAIGGSAGDGGDGGNAVIELGGSVSTQGDFADAFHVQSIGGGGGKGSNALSTGVEFSTAIGGNGGSGGDGGAITVTETSTGSIQTSGTSSSGLVLQSVGGGGGNGGYAISASAGIGIDASVGSGGNGAVGGHGGDISVTIASGITTSGDLSHGVQAQSVGGGGGNGGMSISSANTSGVAMSASVGGKGGGGGSGGTVDITTSSAISTSGSSSFGIMAQSVGGGGGSSGMSIDANAVSNFSLAAAVGRSGGGGGDAGDVTVHSTAGYVATNGDSADAIFAQSVGGNGGYAGMVVAASGDSSNTSVDLAVGGEGGAGGDAGVVTVTVEEGSAVSTVGDNAIAINAQSIGGGGGHGSMTVAGSLESGDSINLAIGGAGGGGGDGGDVTVYAFASTYTKGDNSIGILAKSVGGSGGSGGLSIAGDGSSNGAATVNISGNGGGGHKAGNVTVDSTTTVVTDGIYATGIKAMSIGGGGGSATGAISGTTSSMGQAAVTIGGEGGGGGSGGDVTVLHSNELLTLGDYADGILALSMGGSGGHGAFSAAGSLSAGEYSASTGVTLGGAGGGGGAAGTISITTWASTEAGASNKILTAGYQSRGIIATSQGGNGGFGGSAYSGALNLSSEASMQADVVIGGDGGTGGAANDVNITNVLLISTTGHYSDGILAASIGGDGGVGGNAVGASITTTDNNSANFQTAVGGSGGSGSVGGAVSITNSAQIKTEGVEASGIYAQSTGGGGGRAGNAGTAVFDYTSSQQGNSDKTVAMNVAISVGGNGGSGHHGGTVTVENSGDITVGYEANDEDGNQIADRMAYGIFAQSTGGGGGDGGSVSAFNMSVVGACTFNKTFLPSEISCDTGDDSASSPKTTYSPNLSLVVGGNGGSAGDGDTVSVTNDGAITTSGTGSYGIYAQSTGGGGGTGGGGSMGLEYVLPDAQVNEVLGYIKTVASSGLSNGRSFQSLSLTVGGQGGSSGDGGDVTVTNTGSVTTSGFSADAIQVLSTGGGGGNGGTAYTGLGSPGIDTFAVGGTGSGGGDGGHITVTSSGSVATTGIDAMGIFAQSVGGGGGRAGAVSRALVGELGVNMNVGFAVGGTLEAGDGGDGGKVDVTVGEGGLTTTGIRAHGVWAQSVGGGGGASSWGGGLEDAENQAISFAGGGGDYGSGGDVTVTVDGALSVTGISAVGVFGQSVSGANMVTTDDGQKAGSVTATINGSVSATGFEGRGIFLQSDGLDGNGKLYVYVAEGGTVFAGSRTKAAILLGSGDSDNTVDNYGIIQRTESDDASLPGFALKTYDGAVTVNNYNYFEGSVSLVSEKENGSSVTNSFYNTSDSGNGQLAMGRVFNLGDGDSTLYNSAFMTTGTFGAIGDTTIDSIGYTELTGALVQDSSGLFWVDHDFSGNNDLLFVLEGDVDIAGEVFANPVGGTPGNGASGTFPILQSSDEASGGVTIDDSTFTEDTAIIDYTLIDDGNGVLFLQYDVNYAAWEAEPQRSYVNQAETPEPASTPENVDTLYNVVGYLTDLVDQRNTALSSGSNDFDSIDQLVVPLLSLRDVDDVIEVYQHISSGDLMRLTDASLHSSYRFSNSLMSCPQQGEDGRITYEDNGSCGWMSLGGVTRNVSAESASTSYDENNWGLAAGAQIEVSKHWFLGGAVSFEDVNYSTSISGGDGTRFQLGGVLKHEIGNHNFALSVSGGIGDYDLRRNRLAAYGITSEDNDADNSWAALMGRYSHQIEVGGNTLVEPYLGVGVTWVRQDGTEIDGSLPIAFDVKSDSATKIIVNPGVEVGRSLETPHGPLDIRLGVGFLGLYGDDFKNEISAANIATAGSFTASSDFDNNFVELKARVAGRIGDHTSMRLSLGALLGENDQSYGGDVRISHQF